MMNDSDMEINKEMSCDEMKKMIHEIDRLELLIGYSRCPESNPAWFEYPEETAKLIKYELLNMIEIIFHKLKFLNVEKVAGLHELIISIKMTGGNSDDCFLKINNA